MKKIVIILILTWFISCYSITFSSLKYSKAEYLEQQSSRDIGLEANRTSTNNEKVSANNSHIQSKKSSSSIPNELLNLYPLAIGNRWIYLEEHGINPNIWYEVILKEVLGDSIAANGKQYYHILTGTSHSLERIDSTSGFVYRYYQDQSLPENEYLKANLFGELGDSINTFDPSYPSGLSYIKIIQIDTTNIWGLSSIRKYYQQITPGPFHLTGFWLMEDIGIYTISAGLPLYGIFSYMTLKGCVINGIVYGDTTPTDINEEGNHSVKYFRLEQNYPNPFNPSTKISWQSPVSGWQTLKVYDVLGNEVATLIDEYRNAGSYEVEFKSSVGSWQTEFIFIN